MKNKDSLHRLVKSLNRSEKRFFKIYSSRHVIGDGNKYVQLFDAIDRQKNYNEAAILKKFSGEKFAKRLPVAKAYLYELVLKSMNVYHAQADPQAQLREMMGKVSFLNGKSMYAEALKVLQKAFRLAEEYEALAQMPELLRLHKKILDTDWYAGQPQSELLRLHRAESDVCEKLQIINDYWLLQARLYHRHHHRGIARDQRDLAEISDLLDSPLLADESRANTHQSRLLMYRFYATYFFSTRDFANCYKYSQKLVELLQSRSELMRQDMNLYVNALNNLLNMASVLGKGNEKRKYLEELKKMRENRQGRSNPSLDIKLFEVYYYHQLNHHISQNQFGQALPVADEMMRELDGYKDGISDMATVMLCFYGFHAYFGAEKHQPAHQLLQSILQFDPENVREDIYTFSNILSLLTAYELKDEPLQKRTIRKVYAYLYKKDRRYHFETLVMQFLKEMAARQPLTQARFGEMLAQLNVKLQSLTNDRHERKAFAYFDFVAWLNGKLPQKHAGTLTAQ